MTLRKKLYQHCKDNNLEDLSCIIQFALVNYISSHKSTNDWVYISPVILNSFIGIGEEKIIALLDYISSNYPNVIGKSYKTYCIDNNDEFCHAIRKEDIEDEEIELPCEYCHTVHNISNIDECIYEVEYEGNKQEVIKELKIENSDVAKEIVILNTNSENVDKLAEIILSRLTIDNVNKKETKNGLVKMLQSTKEISGLIAGISGDVADTSSSVIKLAENFSGFSSIRDFIKS